MNNLREMTIIKKIETMFNNDFNYSFDKYKKEKKIVRRTPQLKHLIWIPSLIYKRIYWVLPKILKDFFFFFSIIHKSPKTKIFAKTRYEEFRILLDIKVSRLIMKIIPKETVIKVNRSFNSGFALFSLSNIYEINPLIDNVIKYTNPSHGGARPYFKDGKELRLKDSFSAYYSFSKQDNEKINLFLEKNLDKNFDYYLSALAGYKCKLRDMTFSLSIVFGENSNSEMHQDTYGSVAKGFIYLQDIEEGNSPFEYLEGSYLDAAYRSKQTNRAIMDGDLFSDGSTRLRHKALNDGIRRFGIKTFTGSKGTFLLANTSGYHRKGAHNSSKPRIILACGVKRKSMLTKLFLNLFEIYKSKIS